MKHKKVPKNTKRVLKANPEPLKSNVSYTWDVIKTENGYMWKKVERNSK